MIRIFFTLTLLCNISCIQSTSTNSCSNDHSQLLSRSDSLLQAHYSKPISDSYRSLKLDLLESGKLDMELVKGFIRVIEDVGLEEEDPLWIGTKGKYYINPSSEFFKCFRNQNADLQDVLKEIESTGGDVNPSVISTLINSWDSDFVEDDHRLFLILVMIPLL